MRIPRALAGLWLLLAGAACALPDGGSPSAPAFRASTPAGAAVLAVDRADAAIPAALPAVLDAPAGLLLLGEIHDHPLQHGLRAHWLEALARHQRFALALEQFDVERQGDLDAARRRFAQARAAAPGTAVPGSARPDPGTAAPATGGLPEAARALAESAGFDFRGWHWPFYAPYIELALRHDLPIIAANLSNAATRRIARGEDPPPAARPSGWGAAEDAAMAAEIRDGHCGMMPERGIAPMALAQQARDATMARALAEAGRVHGLPVVLLAGNGHVRQDLGVPRHLRDVAPRPRMLSVGFVESAPPPAAYGLAIVTPRHARKDPCEGLKAVRGSAG